MSITAVTATKSRSLSVCYFDEQVLLSNDSAWAYFNLPTVAYEFRSPTEREMMALWFVSALSNLSVNETDCHLLMVPREYPTQQWAERLDGRVQNPAETWEEYLVSIQQYLAGERYYSKEVYLGIRLGPRGAANNAAAPLLKAVGLAGRFGGLDDAAVGEKEVADWHRKADPIARTLGGSRLKARRATCEELRWLIQRSFYRGMGEPPTPAGDGRPWGKGSIELLAEGFIENSPKALKLHQPGRPDTHVAFLSAARFPDYMEFPEDDPWLHYFELLWFPVEASIRFRLVPARTAQKHINRKIAEAADQRNHIEESGSNVSMELMETLQSAEGLKYDISKSRQPLVYGQSRFCVVGATEEELENRTSAFIDAYRDLGIEMVRPSGDQFALFMEAFPGDRTRSGSYQQKQGLPTLAGGMPTATGELGDREGPYIGYTTGRVRSIVHVDPLTASSENKPTAIAITGAPGGGKTNAALLITYQMVLRGVWTVYVDPKGDAVGLANLPGIGKAQVLDLSGDGLPGLLDPFAMADSSAEGRLLAMETLKLMLSPEMPEAKEAVMTKACRLEEQHASEPSLYGVIGRVEELVKAGEAGATSLLNDLEVLSDLPIARLCFSKERTEPLTLDGALTVIRMSELEFPDPSVRRQDQSYKQRLSVAVMFLVADMTRRLAVSRNRLQPKAIVFDEAWMLTSTQQGKVLIPTLARMGRSRNTAVMLISQNAKDLLDEDVLNCITTVLAFRSTNKQEVEAVLRLLGAEQDDPSHQREIQSLENGECVLRDVWDRVGKTKIDLVFDYLTSTFDTTPRREAERSPDLTDDGTTDRPVSEEDRPPAMAGSGAPARRNRVGRRR